MHINMYVYNIGQCCELLLQIMRSWVYDIGATATNRPKQAKDLQRFTGLLNSTSLYIYRLVTWKRLIMQIPIYCWRCYFALYMSLSNIRTTAKFHFFSGWWWPFLGFSNVFPYKNKSTVDGVDIKTGCLFYRITSLPSQDYVSCFNLVSFCLLKAIDFGKKNIDFPFLYLAWSSVLLLFLLNSLNIDWTYLNLLQAS